MSRIDRSARWLLGGALLVGLAACGDGQEGPPGDIGQDPGMVSGDSAVLTTTEPVQLDDAHIAAILAQSDTAEIAPSELARDAAQDPSVRAFAEMMIEEHGQLSDSLRALTQAEGIVPAPGRESDLLRTQTEATLESLQGQSGAAFDSAYVAAMVQSHEMALNTIDDQLIPAATNPALRMAIEQQVRPRVAAHLEEIEQIQTTLASQ